MRVVDFYQILLEKLQELLQYADSGRTTRFHANKLREAGTLAVQSFKAMIEGTDYSQIVPPEFMNAYEEVKADAIASIDAMREAFADPPELPSDLDWHNNEDPTA
jgi:hypothetical protein